MREIAATFQEVFRYPGYVASSLVSGLLFIAALTLLPNYELIGYTFVSDTYPLLSKIRILWSSLSSFQTNFTVVSRITLITAGVFVGINFSFLVFYFRRQLAVKREAGLNFFGILLSLLGIGCSTCGSVILSSIFGIAATASILSFFPLRGLEINLLSIAILFLSTIFLAKKIQSPSVCTPRKAVRHS